jgi:hypothetical protein
MRQLSVRTFVSAVFAAAALLAATVSAQAMPVAATGQTVAVTHSAQAIQSVDGPRIPFPYWFFTGYTYPISALGLTQCQTKGIDELRSNGWYTSWQCLRNDPVNNRFNLWLQKP